ncbi:hypothetical protein [Prevotella sp. kh1p2]|uniref:hypothetical protein n=1 Tax=Prevotella sp. kh1p2 TaxID=1761883 RepID=UPI0008BA97C1|nr:hypothetical protein [Prevotella sp. kh1p2]SET11250.1 hypothetical protein SAMN04487825_11477 [Prevotella sp. kh1p2]SNU11818.1 hypothetical protein SAMN06298210_11428 [Prevotellaceae bacterium KH2P17]
MKKKYTQPRCFTITASTTISILAGSQNNKVSETGEEVTTDRESGTGDAGYAHAKLWSCEWNIEKETLPQ